MNTDLSALRNLTANMDVRPYFWLPGGALDVDRCPDCYERWAHVERYAFGAGVFRNMRVLDFGCGLGYGTESLALAGNTVTGYDPNTYEEARRRRPSLEFIGAPEDGRWWDGVTAFEVIEHLEDPRAFISGVPAPRLVCSVPLQPSVGVNPHHKSDFTMESFRELIASNFNILREWFQTPPFHNQAAYGVISACRR